MQTSSLPIILFHATTSLSSAVASLLFAFPSESLPYSFVSRPKLQCFAVAPPRHHQQQQQQQRQRRRRRPQRTLGTRLLLESSKSNNDNDDQIMMPMELAPSGRDIDDIIFDTWINFEDDEENNYLEEENGTVTMDRKVVDDAITSEKNLIECSASVLLPFSEDVAFDAFSDLTRQPSWCKYLHSVEYIGFVDGNDENEDILPLRQSRWTIGVKGLRFSWTANDTRIVRPNHIEWESTSGLKNMGSVTFSSQSSTTSSSSSEIATEMTICFAFVAPRVVSSLFRRSGTLRKYTEEVLLGNMLSEFRNCLTKELEGREE